jgi:hypothetical protein
MKRPGYRAALDWIARNDDCEWLKLGEQVPLSVTAALVADLFGVDDKRIVRDLQRVHKRVWAKPQTAAHNDRAADSIDGYDRDDTGASPDY